jgi:MFS family permease
MSRETSASKSPMSPAERVAAAALAGVYFLRMLGLFIVLPTYALGAAELQGATEALVGLGVGIYGGTQALLQIPFGRWSDRLGRKPVIVGGLLIFVVGSLVAASADHILMSILGRALQGAGAVSAAIMALAADLTRESSRTRVMAMIGISIGVSFALAFVLGPVIAAVVGLMGVFGFAAVLGLAAIALVIWVVPEAPPPARHGSTPPDALRRALSDTNLLRLNAGIFCLHFVLTATFVVLPLVLRDTAGLEAQELWRLYLPALLLSVACVMPMARAADHRGNGNRLFLAAIAALVFVEAAWAFYPGGQWLAGLLLLGFFLGFNLLEASLPALVSRAAPQAIRGTALGVYATTQFLGTFLGGAMGGLLHGGHGTTSVFLMNALVAGLWWGFARGLRLPAPSGAEDPLQQAVPSARSSG